MSDGKSEQVVTWFLNLILICRFAATICAVFAVQPWGSAEFPPVLTNSWSTAFSQTSATSCEKVAVPIARGTDSVSLRVSPWWFLEKEGFPDKPHVAKWLPKTFSCNPGAFHVSRGRRLSQLSMEEESLLADWKRKTRTHCNFIQAILLSHS